MIVFAHEAPHDLVPDYVTQMLSVYEPGRSLRSSDSSLFHRAELKHLVMLLSARTLPDAGTASWRIREELEIVISLIVN